MRFRIIGNTVPAVEICFDQPGEEMITQAGGMAWMSDGIDMSTDTNGGPIAGLSRLLVGETVFMAHYRALKSGATIAFATTVPRKIVPLKMKDYPNGIVCQKGAFLCAQPTVKLKVEFTRNLASGFFGGEGFVLEKLTGSGAAFLEVDGDIVEKTLASGEVVKVDTGNIVAFESGMPYQVETVRGLKNVIFGGEGLFLARLVGPGKIILQTQNLQDFANSLSKLMTQKKA